MQFATSKSLVTALILASLSACGGGGGDAPAVTPAPAPTSSTPVPAPAPALVMQTTVPNASYTGKQADAYSFLNERRTGCGLGKLAQNTVLDTSVANHIAYSVANGYLWYGEIVGNPGFTGVDATARAVAAGLPQAITTNVVNDGLAGSVGTSSSYSVEKLLIAPYHAFGALGPYKFIGVGVRSYATERFDAGSGKTFTDETNTAVLNYAYDTPQGQATALTTYPCDGTVVNIRNFANEIPDAGASLGLRGSAGGGHPVMVQSTFGTSLQITKASIVELATLKPIALLGNGILTAQNDTNRILRANQAAIVPDFDLLEAGKSYLVEIEVTIDNKAQPKKTFVFSVAPTATRL